MATAALCVYRRAQGALKILAVEAVESELVSSPIFPVCREKTGNFKRIGRFRA
jgi:hypothetical protein